MLQSVLRWDHVLLLTAWGCGLGEESPEVQCPSHITPQVQLRPWSLAACGAGLPTGRGSPALPTLRQKSSCSHT